MDVRGALLDRIEQDLVDETHDRRVFDVVPAERLRIRIFIAAGDFEILEIEVVVGQARHGRFGLIDRLVDRRLQLVVLDDDELDAHRGLKPDLVQRVQIGRIGDGQEQPLAALHQRQHAVLLQELVAHRANRVHDPWPPRRDRGAERRIRSRLKWRCRARWPGSSSPDASPN